MRMKGGEGGRRERKLHFSMGIVSKDHCNDTLGHTNYIKD